MRPNQLTLTAFGPYHQTETIDFDALAPHNLFVVSGNTGAGKTTIFDGISYALFGGASGEDRKDTSSLRSDFADDGLPTSVELIFTLQDKQYRIFRQLPYLKAGNKSQTPGKAELYEIKETEEVSIVDRQITQDVDKKILAMIVLSREQFNQLVMLPQGEHQRFLTSKTDEKEAILRTLFNTEKYRALTDQLKLKHDEQSKTVLQLTAKNSVELRSIFKQLPARDVELFSYINEDGTPNINHHQALAGLELEKTHYAEANTRISAKVSEEDKVLANLYKAQVQAEALNQKFEQLMNNEGLLKAHLASEAKIVAFEKNIQWAERAQPLEKYFDEVGRLRMEAKTVLTSLNKVKEAHQKSQQALQILAEKLACETQKAPEREQLQRAINRLEDNKEAVTTLASQQQQLSELQKRLALATAQIKQSITARELVVAQKVALTQELGTLEQVSKTHVPLMKLAPLLQQLQKLLKKRDQLSAQNEKLTQEKLQSEVLLKSTKSTFDQAMQDWRGNQATLLAGTLVQGKPCPVCGSKEHPNQSYHDDLFANLENDATTNKNLTADLEHAFNNAQTALMQAEANVNEVASLEKRLEVESEENITEQTTLFAQLEKFYESDDFLLLAPIELPKINGDVAQHEWEALLLTVEAKSEQAAQAQRDWQAQTKKLAQLESELTVHNETVLSLKEVQTQHNNEYIRLQAVLESALKNIPEELQNLEAFTQNLQEKNHALQALKVALETTEKTHKTESDGFITLRTQLAHEDSLYQKLTEQGKEAKARLDQQLNESGFMDESAFINARIAPDQLKILRDEVTNFHQQTILLTQKIEDAKAQLQDKKPVDLATFTLTIQQKESALEVLREDANKTTHYLNFIQALVGELQANHAKIEKETQHLNKLAEVYQLIRGNNSLKLSFERYILIEYFERVIESANLRLQKMTNGQFEFMRSEGLASGGKQSGLDLDIYDAYTGEARNVKTLSGGEKFKASLSLSLGMADVIQAHQGGIAIETLFIDEGFGSLDEESLLQAMDTLIELQASGRMIGIISHVEELKQTLPARIEVTKTKGGYSKTAVVVR